MLWDHLTRVDLPDAQWILAGDFNNIEHISDKQGGSPKTNIGRRELEAWNRLLVRLGVRDAFHIRTYHRKSEKVFTWSNARIGEDLIQSRIDRIYIPNHLEYREAPRRFYQPSSTYQTMPEWSFTSMTNLGKENPPHLFLTKDC